MKLRQTTTNGFDLTECTLNRVELQYRALPDTGFLTAKNCDFGLTLQDKVKFK